LRKAPSPVNAAVLFINDIWLSKRLQFIWCS